MDQTDYWNRATVKMAAPAPTPAGISLFLFHVTFLQQFSAFFGGSWCGRKRLRAALLFVFHVINRGQLIKL